jgi:para-aminobenzoate synthetase/4-amino-4-deoxychorismate lyase
VATSTRRTRLSVGFGPTDSGEPEPTWRIMAVISHVIPPPDRPEVAPANRIDQLLTVPTVRFDDMSVGTTTTLTNFVGEFRATSLSDVLTVIESAEQAARDGQWVGGYVAYDAAPAFDEALVVPPSRRGSLPLAWFGVFASGQVGDVHSMSEAHAITTPQWTIGTSRSDYERLVALVQDQIRVGEVYQVNLTTRVTSHDDVDPAGLYRQLLLAQQPAYGALIVAGDFAVMSASPELFFEWHDAHLRCRPMKGTRRRGRFAEEDRELAQELLESAKEQSENIMIVDLMRNDMAKVAELGSVLVTGLLELEEYPQVFQLVSEVRCRTPAATRLTEILAALFPCGSVTGAPKTSAMSLIASIEDAPRGVYCGTVGLIAPCDRGTRRVRDGGRDRRPISTISRVRRDDAQGPATQHAGQ